MDLADLHNRLRRVERGLYLGIMAVCIVLLALIVVVISASITARWIVFTPLNFADPLSKYLMQWIALLGVGLAICRGEHVVVSALSDRVPLRLHRSLALLINALVACLFAVILWYGTIYALSGRSSSDPFVFGVPMIVPYLSVPVGALYALIQTILATGLILTTPQDQVIVLHSPVQGM